MDRVTFKGFAYGAIAAASYGLNPLFALPLYADMPMAWGQTLCYFTVMPSGL